VWAVPKTFLGLTKTIATYALNFNLHHSL